MKCRLAGAAGVLMYGLQLVWLDGGLLLSSSDTAPD